MRKGSNRGARTVRLEAVYAADDRFGEHLTTTEVPPFVIDTTPSRIPCRSCLVWPLDMQGRVAHHPVCLCLWLEKTGVGSKQR
jgi:hypothetical protein